MSSLSTFSSKSNAKPPQKGSFPLDHDGECKEFMIKYMQCLRINKKDASKCRQESKEYLHCRMESNLMLKEDWKKLGFSNDETEKKTS
ncbi:cytochrome c oxidase assembly protein cox19 [Plakobranchus ocellatus]|uniref:Cytochrome c oxidase assembly protein cox19 n=1 Tax=Plakobranchus ocellatus TaxID=259542 RepID=A0AAV4DU04_9GAST|nr:cytochrome c oxidase assembly protein cox19 [Plakobranchus ocellatus]